MLGRVYRCANTNQVSLFYAGFIPSQSYQARFVTTAFPVDYWNKLW